MVTGLVCFLSITDTLPSSHLQLWPFSHSPTGRSVFGVFPFFLLTGRISSVKEKERKEEIRAVTAVSFFIALIKSTVWIDFSVYKPQQQGHKTALDDRHDHLFSF